jgi:hypothetical protein
VYDDVARKITVTQESSAGQLGVAGKEEKGERGKFRRPLFRRVLGGDTHVALIVSGKVVDFSGFIER